MRFVVYCIELAKEDQAKAEPILHKYYTNGNIDIKNMEHSRRNYTATVQYWITCICSSDIEIIASELEASGIELF